MSSTSETETVPRGWIQPCGNSSEVANYRRVLEGLGIQVGPWDMVRRQFDECAVSIPALEKLDPLWGQYIWGLS
jgi:hypothetical protein